MLSNAEAVIRFDPMHTVVDQHPPNFHVEGDVPHQSFSQDR